jgi:hypothetical protein
VGSHVADGVESQRRPATGDRRDGTHRHRSEAGPAYGDSPGERITMRRFSITAALALLLALPHAADARQTHSGGVHAPTGDIKPSQHAEVRQRIGRPLKGEGLGTLITVVYSRPVARGRALFGKLVPWGRIWCPCADDATTVQVSTDVKINGQPLPAGTYTLWSEPEAESWTIIFSKASKAWHTQYPADQDALRLKVTPRSGEHMETLAFYFPVVDGRTAELVLHWGRVVVPMTVEVP